MFNIAKSKAREKTINLVCIGGQLIDTGGVPVADDDNDDAAKEYNYNHLYYSTDGGYKWSKSDAKHARWMGLVSNEDGSWVVAIIKHTMKYVWASDDGGKTFFNINKEEKNEWNCLAASKDLNTMMLTDDVSRNVHISFDLGYSWTQVYKGQYLDDDITVNACAVAAYSGESDDDDDISLALGFTGQSMKVAYDCNHDTCLNEWKDTGSSNSDADTFTVALSGNGKYFYSVDSKTSKISIGTRKNLKKNFKI